MPGRLIAIEGIDGSGKGTQAKLLYERLRREGRKVALLSFPRYSETRFGGYIGEYLNGRFGTLEQVHPFLAALLFSGDRFESRGLLLDALATNDVVICDRYVGSNIAHQGARVPAEERSEFIARIEAVEYEVFALPRPDRTILLDLSVANATRLIATKAKREYTERTADLHEAASGYLESVRSVYRTLAVASADWEIIPCETDGAVRPIEEIAKDVYRSAGNVGQAPA